MKKFIGILISTTFIFSGNLLNAFELKDNRDNSVSSDLNVDFLKNLKVDNYMIGPGDSLAIKISFMYPELNREVIVDGEGTISLPKIKKIYVEGLTSTELVNLLNKAFKKFINYPDVELTITNYRPIRIYVEGEVVNPGLLTMNGALKAGENTEFLREKSFSQNLEIGEVYTIEGTELGYPSFYFPTVFDAIRGSGGITPKTDLSNIQIIRKNTLSEGGGLKKTILNFERMIDSGDDSQNIRIYDGDIIKLSVAKETNINKLSKAIKSNLNPKYINVYVTGRVLEPGGKVIPKTSSLNDAIDIAGGTKILKGKVKYVRFNNDGSIDKRSIRYSQRARRGSYKNPLLSNGDLIVVGNSLFSNTSEVITEITQPFTGLFSTYGLIKVINEE